MFVKVCDARKNQKLNCSVCKDWGGFDSEIEFSLISRVGQRVSKVEQSTFQKQKLKLELFDLGLGPARCVRVCFCDVWLA